MLIQMYALKYATTARCEARYIWQRSASKVCQYARKVHFKVEYTPKTAVKQMNCRLREHLYIHRLIAVTYLKHRCA